MRKTLPVVLTAMLFFLMFFLQDIAHAEETSSNREMEAIVKEIRHGRIELKRQATNRGTPEETTKTQLKIDTYLNGFVSLLRLEVPFPDEETTFEGDPFNPRLGDIKVRTGFRPFHVDEIPVSTFLEVTFPTADLESLGGGKYQLRAGIQPTVRIPLSEPLSQSHKMTFSALAKQVFSVAGEEDRKNSNYTQFVLAFRDTWRNLLWLKLTPKPVVDWE